MVTPPRTIVGSVAQAPVLRNPWLRRLVLFALIAVCAVLTLYPERYRAAVSLTPSDPASIGLSTALSQLGAVQNVFGSQTAVEVSLKVARSDYVRESVSKSLKLPKRLDKSDLETVRWLEDEVEVRSLRGGIIQIELLLEDSALAQEIVSAYADAVRGQLAIVARDQTEYKREILEELVSDASNQLAEAQARYDTFRLQSRYSSPEAAIAAIGERVPQIEDMLQSKQVELNAARAFYTEDNIVVRRITAEIAALNRQLAEARSTSPTDPNSVGRVVRESTEVDRLRRDLDLARGLYENYKIVLQGTTVEDLTSSANIRILEPAYVDTERQYNLTFAAIAILLLLLAIGIEFYAWRMPVGTQRETVTVQRDDTAVEPTRA